MKRVLAVVFVLFSIVVLFCTCSALTSKANFQEENDSLVELRIFGNTSDQWLGQTIVVHVEFGRGQSQTIKCPVEKQKIRYEPKAEASVNYFWCSTWIPKGSYFVSLSTAEKETLANKHGSTWWPWDLPFFGSKNCGFSLK